MRWALCPSKRPPDGVRRGEGHATVFGSASPLRRLTSDPDPLVDEAATRVPVRHGVSAEGPGLCHAVRCCAVP